MKPEQGAFEQNVSLGGQSLPSIRSKITVVVLVCAFAAFAAIGALIFHFYERERGQLERDALQTARALALAVDRDLSSGKIGVVALSHSHYLKVADFAAFHRQARDLLGEGFPGNNFVLSDRSGQQLVNTLRSFGEPLPRYGNQEQLAQVFASGQPVISDIYTGPVLHHPVVSIAVPVFGDGKVAYCLSVIFLPERLGKILAEQHLSADRIAAIFDSKGVIVARTRDQERFVGQMGAAELVKRLMEGPEGVVETRTLEGIPVYSIFSRSAVTGWSVAIGIPSEAVLPELLHSIATIALLAGALLATGFAVAWLLGSRIGLSVRQLTVPALALGEGRPVIVPPAYLGEVDEVAKVLQRVGIELEAYRHHLQSLVDERTEALNHALEASRKAEEALREREEIYSAIVNQAVDGIVLIDVETRTFAEFNDAACSGLGYSRDEFSRLTLQDVQDVLNAQQVHGRIQMILNTPEGSSFENAHRCQNGDVRVRRISNRRLTIHGRTFISAIWHDITEQKRAVNEVREARERLDLALAGSGEALWDCDLRDGSVYLSEQWTVMLGEEAKETRTTTQALAQLVPSKERERLQPVLVAALKGVTPDYDIEHCIQTRRGEVLWIRCHGKVTRRDANGRALRITGTNTNITQHRLAEQGLRLAASVFSEAQEGIIITDAQSRITDVNRAFSDLTGYSKDEVLGRNPRILKSGHHDADFYAGMWKSLVNDGHWEGEIWNRRKDGKLVAMHYTIGAVRGSDGATSHYIALFVDITERKRQQEQIEHLAFHDPLTRLPNRTLLVDRMQQALTRAKRNQTQVAICYLDLDGFKPVNDRFGHKEGDRLLTDVSRRLESATRGQDTIARLGGDEFVLVLADLESFTDSDSVLTRVLHSISEPFTVDAGIEVSLTASIGVTIFPGDGSDSDTLLRHADQAMYQAKKAGKNRFHLFDPESDRHLKANRERIERAELGLAAGEFCLFYQPTVDIRRGTVVGAEALIRWQHPEEGLLLPIAFLPVVETSPFAATLGHWVVDQALQQIEVWATNGLTLPISINVSTRYLLQSDFVANLALLLAQHPSVSSQLLQLEIPETAVMGDADAIAGIVAKCKALGVEVALDDFGAGYSSLAFFRRLPTNTLKLDQSFIAGILDDSNDLAIVEGVIGLARTFGRKIIAEGVETIDHGIPLLQFGCDLVQGYALAKPMPAKDFPDWVRGWKRPDAWNEMAVVRWARDDFPSVLAGIQHRRWIDRFVAACSDTRNPVPPPLDKHQCAFGQWFYGVGQSHYGDLEAFRGLESLHDQAHGLARELLALRARDQSAAVNRLPELLAVRVSLLGKLDTLKQQVLTGLGG